MITLANGIDLDRFDLRTSTLTSPLPKSNGTVLVCVGRLLPQKGHEFLLECMAKLVKENPQIVLWIVGEGPERKAIEQKINDLNLGKYVELLGYRNDVPALLVRADIYVNASSWEGMSNAVLEGMAAVLPSVLVDAPGVTECHINKRTGLVVERDTNKFVVAVKQLLFDPVNAKKMGVSARKHVQDHFSMHANRARYDEVAMKLVAGKI